MASCTLRIERSSERSSWKAAVETGQPANTSHVLGDANVPPAELYGHMCDNLSLLAECVAGNPLQGPKELQKDKK